jgi:hypothetical protein
LLQGTRRIFWTVADNRGSLIIGLTSEIPEMSYPLQNL